MIFTRISNTEKIMSKYSVIIKPLRTLAGQSIIYEIYENKN